GIRQFNQKAEIIECAHHPLYLQDVFTGERHDLKRLNGLAVGAISGIASPGSFEDGLRGLGADVIHTRRYADHHRYTQQEILNMINRSIRRGAKAILTTEKDAVRFPKIDRRDIPVYFLRVEIKII